MKIGRLILSFVFGCIFVIIGIMLWLSWEALFWKVSSFTVENAFYGALVFIVMALLYDKLAFLFGLAIAISLGMMIYWSWNKLIEHKSPIDQ